MNVWSDRVHSLLKHLTVTKAMIAHKVVTNPVPMVNRIMRFAILSLLEPLRAYSFSELRSTHARVIVIAMSPDTLKTLTSLAVVTNFDDSVSSVKRDLHQC